MNFSGKHILFIGAHPDDIELGCGALLAHISASSDLLCLTLSDNQSNTELGNLVNEHRRSMATLGVSEEKVLVEQFETRNFVRDRQSILEYLYDLGRRYQPDLVFVHTPSDIHQDHGVATQEALRAFRGISVLGFDVLRSSYGFFPNFLVEVTQQDVDRKLQALAEYQTYADRYYFDPEVVRATLIRHGALAERRYAEGFDSLRIVGEFVGDE